MFSSKAPLRIACITALATLVIGCRASSPAAGSSIVPAASVTEPPVSHATPNLANYKRLYAFNGKNGANPSASLTDVNGTLYGTTEYGGSGSGCETPTPGCGTVFKITTSGIKTIYSFKGELGNFDGAFPVAGLTNVNGTLYGTTSRGGRNVDGTVFKMSTSGVETVLYSFKGGHNDGARPLAGLTNVDGTLYGTTWLGGGGKFCNGDGCGTVFKITPSGKESLLYRFRGPNDGAYPYAGLTYVDGALYGTTLLGGRNVYGTAFAIAQSGAETVLYSFSGGPDGSEPRAGLANVNGTLYGTTSLDAIVFKITKSGTESNLHTFGGRPDGLSPMAGLSNVNGTLYGTTSLGGRYAAGAVYKITTRGAETVLYSFRGGTDGAYPVSALTNFRGQLYGATQGGGGSGCLGNVGCGTLFRLAP
jgi:uncharacterized repeat protein (TIGR03803 family)